MSSKMPRVHETDRRCIQELVVTNLRLKGSLNAIKGKLKQKYGQLTDQDSTFAEGKEAELLVACKRGWAERKSFKPRLRTCFASESPKETK